MRLTELFVESALTLSDNGTAKAWIKKVYDQFQPWPMNHAQRVIVVGGEGEDQQFAWFELVSNPAKQNTVEIKWIGAHPQRQGVGTKALKILQDLASQDNISLTLYPWDKGVVSQSQLTKFYKKSGFNSDRPGGKNMTWNPTAVNEDGGGESVTGPFKVVSFDPQSRITTLASGAKITLAPNVKDRPKPGYNYAFIMNGDVASKLVLLTVDTVITTGKEILLILRKNEPFAGHWALPGGFIDPGESPDQAAHRELEEETGVTVGHTMKFVGKFDTPHRDPRMTDTWSYAYSLRVPTRQLPTAGDDATRAEWKPISEITKLPLAFDHMAIIRKALS